MKYLRPSQGFTSLLQLITIPAIWFAVTSNIGLAWWLGSLFFLLWVYMITGNHISLHRYFTHGHFTVAKPIEYFFLWAGVMSGLGSPTSYAVMHLVHHKYSDTDLDPHGPVQGMRSWLVWFQKTVDISQTPVFSRRLIEVTSRYSWVHQYYVPIVLTNAAIFYLIDWRAFLMLWLIPAGLNCWIIAWSVWRQHIGYKPNNSPIARWDILSESLHKNHHDWPMAPNTAIHHGEIDWPYQFSKIYRPTYNYKFQPKKIT